MNQPDAKIIGLIKSGNLKAFEEFFRSLYQPLCYYALKFVSSHDVAEEIVQDLFYTLWEKHEELIINTSLKSYMYAATHNKCLKYIEHRKIEMKYEEYIQKHSTSYFEPTTDKGNIKEIQQIIDNTLNSLPAKCSRIFRMNRFEGLRYNDIAQKLSISVKTVEANMGKALKLLRKNLKAYIEMA
jgi:RNA polymerase sigma-70 factor (ECF subfamily)